MINQSEHIALVKKFFPQFNQIRVVGNEYDDTTFIICDETTMSDINFWNRLFMVTGPTLSIQYISSCRGSEVTEADFIQLRSYWLKHQSSVNTKLISPNMNRSWFQKVKRAVLGSIDD